MDSPFFFPTPLPWFAELDSDEADMILEHQPAKP
jgi:hypothetical protein